MNPIGILLFALVMFVSWTVVGTLLYRFFVRQPVGGHCWRWLCSPFWGANWKKLAYMVKHEIDQPVQKRDFYRSATGFDAWLWGTTGSAALVSLLAGMWPLVLVAMCFSWPCWAIARLVWRFFSLPEERDACHAQRALFMLQYRPSSEAARAQARVQHQYDADQRKERRSAFLKEAEAADAKADAFIEECAAEISAASESVTDDEVNRAVRRLCKQ